MLARTSHDYLQKAAAAERQVAIWQQIAATWRSLATCADPKTPPCRRQHVLAEWRSYRKQFTAANLIRIELPELISELIGEAAD